MHVLHSSTSISPSSFTHPRNKNIFEPYNFKLLQSFGDRREICYQEDEDFITSVGFDRTGDYLAVGDRAGRLVSFKYVLSSPYGNFEEDNINMEKSHNLKYKRISSREITSSYIYNPPIEYEYLYDFQSHFKEFDNLKSELIDQKINFIKWMHNNGSQMNLISSNSKTIKLWRISEKAAKKINKFSENGSTSNSPMLQSNSKMWLENETIYKPVLKQEFFKLHKYSINSISIAKNDEFMLTSDDLKIYLWSLNNPNKPYNIIDRTPFDMDELSEVITCSSLNKINDNLCLFATSKGIVNLTDMRIAGVCDKNCVEFKSSKHKEKDTTFFNDILQSISSCEFTGDGDFIVAREYLNLKIWDIKNTKEPIKIIPIFNQVKQYLCKLYENEGIFDRFKVSISKKGRMALTGSYDDRFHLINLNNGENYQFHILNNDEVTFKNLSGGGESLMNGSSINLKDFNLNNKVIQTEFHPDKKCFALACLNCLYIFGG